MSATHNIESSQGDGAAEELLDVLAAMAKCLLQQDAAALADGADNRGEDMPLRKKSIRQSKSRGTIR